MNLNKTPDCGVGDNGGSAAIGKASAEAAEFHQFTWACAGCPPARGRRSWCDRSAQMACKRSNHP